MKKNSLLFIFLFLVQIFAENTLWAQIIDTFSGAELDAAWVDQRANFTVSGGKLLSNGPNAASQTIFLARTTTGDFATENLEWRLWLNLQFAPSSTNYVRYYLMSSVSSLSGVLNGYYIQVGEANQDTIKLFRQIGNARTRIGASNRVCYTSATANYANVRIRVVRSSAGQWTVSSDCSGGENFTQDFQVTDNSITGASFFGPNPIYATNTRYNQYEFDDVYMGPAIVDNTPPSVSGLNVLTYSTLGITFSEPISVPSALVLAHYELAGGVSAVGISVSGTSMVVLTVQPAMAPSTVFTLTVQGISDLAGNVLAANTVLNFTTPSGVSTVPAVGSIGFREIVFNEIMADVNPAPTGLPAVDYIELHNTTNDVKNLQGVVLRDFSSTGTFTDRTITGVVTIAAQGFLLLCSTNARTSLLGANIQGPFATFSSLDPSNDDRFHLFDAFGNLIDSIRYTTAWYKDPTKSPGGWSLEQRNPTVNQSSDINNWAASADERGGTPGQENSIFSLLPPSPGASLNPKDIVFNEIMADPTPPVDLPEVEYLELFNRTNAPIPLRNFVIQDGTVNRTINQNITIPALGYILFVSNNTNRSTLAEQVPANLIFTLSGLSLGNTNDQLILRDAVGNEIDRVSYTDTWYRDNTKKNGGYSLELMRPDVTCTGSFNWKASVSVKGGTPGAQNSVFTTGTEGEANILYVSPLLNDASRYNVIFDMDVSNSAFAIQSNGVGIQSFGIAPSAGEVLQVTLQRPLASGEGMELEIGGIRACAAPNTSAQRVWLVNGAAPRPREIIFSEIMADETPAVALPEAEYIELFNRSDRWIDLQNTTLTDATSTATITGSVLFAPRSYIILCATSRVHSFTGFGKTLGVSGFPSLNNSGELLVLRNNASQELDRVDYKNTWYKSGGKKDGGYSLERYSLDVDCGDLSNWQASEDSSGGTPGRANSLTAASRVERGLSYTSLRFINDNTLQATMSQYVTPASFAQAAVQPITLQTQLFGANSDSILVVFPENFIEGQAYGWTLSGLNTCLNDTLYTLAFEAIKGRQPRYHDIIINEFLADVSPAVGLPEYQFVELYNKTSEYIDIGGYRLNDRTGGGKIPVGTVMEPQSYLILCGTSGLASYRPYGRSVSVPSFPSLNISSDLVQLAGADGQVIDQVEYTNEWYGDQVKKEGGYTLERIDQHRKCGGALNWTASNDPRGGTPGKINSVQAINPDETPPTLVLAYLKEPDTLVLRWNEELAIGSEVHIVWDDKMYTNISAGAGTKIAVVRWEKDKAFTIKIMPVTDCEGNRSESKDTVLYLYGNAKAGDIMINEIYFNPPVGGVDYIEIINKKNEPVNIQGLQLARLNNGKVEGKIAIAPGFELLPAGAVQAYTTNKAWVQNRFPRSVNGNIVELRSLPTMNDDKGEVLVLNMNDTVLERIYYEERWHNKLVEKRENIALERIRYDIPATTALAWTSASASSGYGTPGLPNSQSVLRIENADDVINIQPQVFSPDQDGYEDLAKIVLQLEKTGGAYSLYIMDMQGRRIKTLASNWISGSLNEHLWDGTDDAMRAASVGAYVVVAEVTDLERNKVERYFKKIVIATRF